MKTHLIELLFRIRTTNLVASLALVIIFGQITTGTRAATVDWGVSQSGSPGIYSWQHLYNWNATGLHQSPLAIPNTIGDFANLNLLNLLGHQTINLNGAVTLGELNIGDTVGKQSYTIAAGTGGSLIFNNGGTAALNKTGLATDVISSNITLTDSVVIDVEDGQLVLSGILSGGGGFTKNGDGTLVLTRANTFTGVNTLNGGITLARPQGDNLLVLGTTGAGTVVNAGATFATGNDYSGAAGLETTGGWGTISEPFTINGDGYLRQGALRKIMGREQDTLGGAITLTGASRIQADYGTLAFTGAMAVNQDLMITGAAGTVNLAGVMTGSNTITHYGLTALQLSGVTVSNTYSGAIVSNLGEIRSNTGVAIAADNPYGQILSLSLKNSLLRLNFGSGAGTANDGANSRFSTTAPISMRSSQINLDNAAFNATATNLFDYTVAQTFGTTTLQGGENYISFRSADAGSVTLTFADILNPNLGTTLEFQIDSLSGGAANNLGVTGSKHKILNTVLEGGAGVSFLGGWARSSGGQSSTDAMEFVKYVVGNGYTPLVAGDYAVNTGEGTWAAGQNIKISSGNVTLTGSRSIQSLNIQSTSARTLSGNAGTVLEIGSGGIISGGAAHVISVPTITAGAGGSYVLYVHAPSSNSILSVIANNGANAVSLVKDDGGTTSFFGNNTYTGTTYLNEGMFRDIIGARNISALGSGNFTMAGGPISQAAYETDRDFTRALGSGAGQVQFTGGGGGGGGSVGFSAYGAPIDVNFGGAGATVTWGSTFFDPGIFTLNGGNASHVVTLVNNLNLGGEQRYIRLDGGSSAGNRAAMGTISGTITNGGIVKRGGGMLYFDDAKTYSNSTIIMEGELWLRGGTGVAGSNVTGNDIQIGGASRLKIDDPNSIGSRQAIIMQNQDDNNASAITFGAGYGSGSEIRFHSITGVGSLSIPQTGAYDITLTNQQRGDNRRNRVAIQIGGNHNFSTDLLAQIKAVAPDVEAWFGADTGNGTYTGTSLTATGRTKTGGFEMFRLGTGSGTLTIANANVLNGAFALNVGAENQTGLANIGGLVYLPNAQNYTGTRTETVGTSVTYGTHVGAGGILVVGQNGALNAANNTILLRSAELRLGVDPTKTFIGGVDTQYSARNIDVRSGTGTLRTATLSGGSNGVLKLNNFLMRMDDADRTFQMLSIGTHRTATHFDGTAVLQNEATARTANFTVGNDNDFQSGLGLLVFNTALTQTGAGAVSVQKNNGGVLVFKADNTYAGATTITQGRLVMAHLGAAGNAGSTISLTSSNDRRAEVDFRLDGSGPFVFDNAVATAGGNDGSSRFITVGSLTGASSNQEVRITSLTSNAGGATTTGNNASGIWFDGFNGYRLTVTGTTTLTRTLTDFRTRGSLVTLSGVVGGAGALNKYEQGTLVLTNNNAYTGTTATYGGYLVLGHDNALGNTTSTVTFNGTSFSQILASGTRTISRAFTNSATNSTQTLGGLDAGAKIFSGAITTTRALNLTAITGGDTTFTGTISGAGGINKVGTGTVILNQTAGTGNTYTGPTFVSQGTLIGEAKGAGSPFGVNSAFTISNGTLRLNNNTGAANTTASTGALNINTGNAALVVDSTGAGGNATTLTFGSLARTNSATLTVKGITTDIGTAGNEKLSFTAAPTLLNGTIGTWAAIQESGSNAAHYAGFSGGNVVTATYGGTGDLDTAAGDTQLFNAGGTGGTLTANRSVFAFRSNANVALGGFTLNLGSANAATLGQAGMILNAGADVSGGTINFTTNALNIYTDDAAVSTISAVLTNFRNNANNTLSTGDPGVPSANVLVKYGPGTLELSGANTFQGNVQVNSGTLSLTAANVIPTFENLNAVTGSIVTIRPGATVLLNGFNQEFGNLSGTFAISPVQNGGGTLNLGTATLTVGRQSSNQFFSGQIIGGVGSKIVKIGTGRLTLDNWDAAIPNSFETADILQGVFTTFANDQSWATPTGFANSMPGTTSVFLRGGEWEIRTPGDSTTNFQIINLGNHVVHQGGDSTLDTDRAAGSGASNKIITLGNLTLDVQRFLVTGGNANYPRFDGSVTLTNHSRVQTDAPLLLSGTISGNYTFTKIGGSNLEISGNNSAWNGGTVATDGTILFATRTPEVAENYQGGSNFNTYSSTANLGTGDIVINRSTAIRINTPGNILAAQGQRVQTFGSAGQGLARVDIGLDSALSDYQIRSTTNGALSLGLNDGFYTRQIDQSKLGNGKWGVSAWATTFYTADSMGAGVDNVYRFTGTNGGTLAITQSGALSGAASLQVGADMVPNGFAITNGNASVRLYGDQTYTGNTIIFRNREAGSTQNFLEFSGDLATPVIDVYGRLMARGAGRFTDDAGNQVNTVNLHVGSTLRLDYNMDVNDTMLISRLENSNLGLEATENKWADNQAMLLNGATLNLINSGGRVNRERVGAITVRNGAAVFLERNGTNGQIILETPSITRSGQATFAVRENANELGRVDLQGQKFFIDNGASMLDAQGLLPVWMINPIRNTFLTYNNDFGVQNATFTNVFTTGDATAAAAFLNGLTSTSIASFAGGQGDPTLAGTVNLHALQVAATADNETTFTGGTINIHSGGLIAANNNAAGRVNFNTTNLYFGDGTTAREAVIYNGANNITTRIGGIVTAANLTMHGIGNLQLTNTSNAITGNIQINSGKLFLDGAGTASSATITMAGDWVQNNDGQQMTELYLRTANADATFNNPIVVAQHTPYVRVYGQSLTNDSLITARILTVPSLTIEGTNTPQGTSFVFGSTSNTNNTNNYSLVVSGETNFGGTAAIGLRVERGGTSIQANGGWVTLTGAVTGSAPIFKSGDGILRLDANNTGLTGTVTLNRGEIRGVGNNANNFFGTGDYILNFGTLRMSSGDAARTYFNNAGQDLVIGGAVNIVNDRNGGAARTLQLGTNNGTNTIRTVNGANWRMTSDSGDSVVLEGKVFINDSTIFFTDNAPIFFRDTFEGVGRFTKAGISQLLYDNNVANTNWTGTMDIQAGFVRVQQDNATLGGAGSSIILNPGAGLSVRRVSNLGTGLGISELRTTSKTSATVLSFNLASEFTNLRTHYNGLSTIGSGVGVLALSGNQTFTLDPGMATFQGGNWFLGALHDTGTLTANSVAAWGTGGNQFLLGGGSASITLNPAAAGAQFAGTGNSMVIGIQHTVFGYATVTFGANSNNTYDGGTFVTRSRNLDGTYRGTVLSVQAGQAAAATYRTPLGSGAVDVFGEIRIEGSNGTARNADSANANTWTFHTGTRLRFDNGTPFGTAATEGRWANNTAIALNTTVLEMYGDDTVNAYNSETVGAISVAGGSEVVLRRRGAFLAEIIGGDLTRVIASGPTSVGNGTLMITGMDTNTNTATGLGIAGDISAMRFLVNNGASLMNNGMVNPWIVGRVGGTFLRYDNALGFQPLTTVNTANYVVTTATSINAGTIGLNDGSRIVSLEATGAITLAANLDVHALRVSRQINASIDKSADGLFNRITIRSGGLNFADTGGTNRDPRINADLYFGLNGTGDAYVFSEGTVGQLNGKIFATKFIKSGVGEVYIQTDQPQFTGQWVVNGGALRFLSPGAPSTGEVILNGSRMSDRDNVHTITEVRYQFNSGSPDLFTWNGGKITAYDYNRVYAITSNDRLQQLPDIDLRTTNATPGTGQQGLLLLQADGARTTVRTGTMTLYDHYQLHIESGSYGTGSTTGFQIGSGTGVNGLDNQGLFDLRKAGDGVLTLGNISGSFDGARSIIIGEGAVRVTHNGSLGAATVTANIEQGGALEIATTGWSPLATLVQQSGSMERWAVDGARSGTVTMGPGVHLQIMHNQTGTKTINMNGGSIMGYLPRDWDQVGVIHTLGSGITINLASNSYLGQPFASSNNSLWDNARIYDIGKINQTNANNPNDMGLRGSYLQIDGIITGVGGLTKLGQDIILLNGANTYEGSTTIENGILQIGRNNALPTGTTLRMETSSGMFDLNGFNQEVAALSGDAGSINNGALDFNTLNVNQASSTTYSGTIDGNVRVRKTGSGTLTFTPVTAGGSLTEGSGYRGGTIIEGGKIAIAIDTALGFVPLNADADNLTLAGGTLRALASFTMAQNRGVLLGTGGGTVEVDPTFTAQVGGSITGVTTLTKTGTGALQFNSTSNTYTGDTHIVSGTLQGGGVNTLAALSRHIVYGDTVSGTLDLNGANQTIGSLASAGATPITATVALGASTLTVGNDRTQNAAYAGIITGTGIFRVNGNGALQTLAVTDNSSQAWNTEIANGILNVALGGKLGSGTLTLGVAGVSGADDFTGLNLSGTTSLANNITITNVNSVGSVSLTGSGGAASSLTGTIAMARDTFVGATSGSELGLTGNISGAGRLVKVDAGTVRLAGTNSFGPGVAGSSGSSFAGSTLVRAGTVLLESNTAAGSSNIAIGDVTSAIGGSLVAGAVDRATFVSILGSGTWNPNGDGLTAVSGGQDSGATTGNGAFIGVSTIIDGFDYASSALGTRILIAGEEANPERNGIYVIAAINGAVMNLVRANDYETSNQMKYGGQVAVTNGTYAGDTFFMFEEDIVVKNETTQEPIRFREDVVNPDIAVLQNVAGLTVANNIQINATNGTGTVTLGGSASLTTGTGTFSGTVQLQDRVVGSAETKTVQVTSAITSGNGIIFSGIISEADTTPVTGDTLSLDKIGAGTVTLTAANTYRGTTTVTGGKLQLGDGGATGSLNTASVISVASGATFVVNQNDTVTQGTEFSGAAISGDGSFQQAGSGTTILTAANTYTGGTSVTDGTLEVNNTSGSGTGSGAVSVTGDAFLTGHGSIQGNTTVSSGATLSAGFDGGSDRTLSFGGDLTMQSGSFWLVDLVEDADGVSDRVSVSGALNITGAIFQEGSFANAFTEGNKYTIASYGSSLTGEFTLGTTWGNNTTRTIGGGDYLINYADGGNFITLTAVPEPGTFGLLGLALAGIIFRRVRKRRGAATAVEGAGE